VGVRFSAPDRPRGPSSPLYNGHWVSFPGLKRLRRGVEYPPPPSVEIKERVELHLYSLSGYSWHVIRWM